MKYVSGEKLQALADLTIIFKDQRHEDLWQHQLPNISYYVVLNVGDVIPDIVFKADSIFIYTHALELFFSRILPHLKKPITLISHNSDHGVDGRFAEVIEDKRIKRWYSQNRLISHPKLFSLPIGIANSRWPHGNQELLTKIKNKNNKKDILVFKNFDVGTNSGQRSICDKITSQNGITLSPVTDIPSYWSTMSRSMFVISPPGNGVDCHRIWEALYLNTVPIVLEHEALSQFKHLPIIFVNSWEEVTINVLKSRAGDFKNFNWNISELSVEYWARHIKL